MIVKFEIIFLSYLFVGIYLQAQLVCPPGSFYNGQQCQKIFCKQNQKIILSNNTCVCDDKSVSFLGKCIKCPTKSYKDPTVSACQPCMDNCKVCQSKQVCTQCESGFSLNQQQKTCSQICGDGKKFVLSCDDGNNASGDGCSSACVVEPGYVCVGGNDGSRDICTKIVPLQVSIRYGFPIITIPGILIDFNVFPPQQIDRSKIYDMFSLEFSDSNMKPNQIIITQHPIDFSRFRCFLSYHSYLPLSRFTIKFTISKPILGQSKLSVDIDTINSGVSSALRMSKDILT